MDRVEKIEYLLKHKVGSDEMNSVIQTLICEKLGISDDNIIDGVIEYVKQRTAVQGLMDILSKGTGLDQPDLFGESQNGEKGGHA